MFPTHRSPYAGALALREPGLLALTEYGDGARLIVANAAEQGDVVWEAPLPPGGAMAAPVASQTHIVVLGVAGFVIGAAVDLARADRAKRSAASAAKSA